MRLVVFYIPCASENQAQKVAWHLISNKLIACANIFPITSIYSWKGKVMNAKEFVIIAKSTKSNFDAVKREVKQVHSYEVPCVVMMDAEANEEYVSWVKQQIGHTDAHHQKVHDEHHKAASFAAKEKVKNKVKKASVEKKKKSHTKKRK